ncbi:hypothetical protein Tco_1548676 [Tanacetum coccineum]
MEHELWTLSMKGDDIDGYTNHFHDLVVMPANVHEAICMAHELVDKSVQAKVTRVNKSNKRRRGKGLSMELIAVQPMCGEKGNYRNKCLKRKDEQNEGARRRAYVMGMEEP